MKWIKCSRDGLECDLNSVRGTCRHLDGHSKVNGILQSWAGKCYDRIETHETKPESSKPIVHGKEALGP